MYWWRKSKKKKEDEKLLSYVMGCLYVVTCCRFEVHVVLSLDYHKSKAAVPTWQLGHLSFRIGY